MGGIGSVTALRLPRVDKPSDVLPDPLEHRQPAEPSMEDDLVKRR